MTKISRTLTVLTAGLALGVLAATPALAKDGGRGRHAGAKATHAHAKASDHDGDADSSSATAYTEDDDTNDGTPNNVADDGDNAHPSGKDRSVEHGGSGTQGKAESHPDDSKGPMRYEGGLGADKANGPGGSDLADQDGNNGCGNDDDFDDDNNGWCGRKPTDEAPATPDSPQRPDVRGVRAHRPAPERGPRSEVLGARERRDVPTVAAVRRQVAPAPSALLPFTGADVSPWIATAIALIALGSMLLVSKRTQ